MADWKDLAGGWEEISHGLFQDSIFAFTWRDRIKL
jgi:hypothetical protein